MVATPGTPAEMFVEGQRHHQGQRFTEAENLYRRVVETDAGHGNAWHHLGLVSLAQNKFEPAAEAFRRVLALAPNHADAHTQLGIVLARLERVNDAVTHFRKAIELRPDFAKAHNNLGVALTQLGRREEGFASYKEAVRLQPDYAEAHFNLAVSQADLNQIAEAIASYERALQIRPEYPDVLYNLGMLLVNERRVGDAVVCLEQAVRFRPDHPEAHNNLSLALAELGRFDEAIASCSEALRLRPLDPKAHMNRGNALLAVGRMEESLASYEFALRLQPDYVNARWNRSLAWLTNGEFERGWREYEWRWKRKETKTRPLPKPQWDGEPLDGKTILLWCEQGVGDMVQFVRYASQLKKHGATVWQECPAHLVPLLSTCPGIDRVFAEGTPVPVDFDCHAPLMSLPKCCNTLLHSIPSYPRYLSGDENEIKHWRSELGGGTSLKIGVTWQGNPKHRWDRHRSFSVQWFRALALLRGVRLFSLQKGTGVEQLMAASFPIEDLRARLDERGGGFEHTAAAIEALDLVITCDSAVAHLAGALGKPVWIPLSALADWRWLRHRHDSPWYPSMRLFRQAKLGEWEEVFERISAAVQVMQRTHGVCSAKNAKVLDWLQLLEIRAKARANGKNVVWTNGCFDLLHVGHVRNLQAARRLGDLLVVGINGDASVRRLKGEGRPVVPITERLEVLASLGCVDHVISFDEDTPEEAIARLQPDIHCKGADYAPANGKPIPEAAIVAAYGGRIEFLPLVPSTSTSDLIERIQTEAPMQVFKNGTPNPAT